MLPLLLLLFNLSPITLVNSSMSHSPHDQENYPIKLPSITFDSEIQDICSWMNSLKNRDLIQSAYLTVDETFKFWSTVRQFLRKIHKFVNDNYDVQIKMNVDDLSTYRSIIDHCLREVDKMASIEPPSESSPPNTVNLSSVKIAQALSGLSHLKNMIKTLSLVLWPEANTLPPSFQLNLFAIEFELLSSAIQLPSQKNSASLDGLLMKHYQLCAMTLAERIKSNLCLFDVSNLSIPQPISTSIQELFNWIIELKDHAENTKNLQNVSSSLQSLKKLITMTLKFWPYADQFLSAVLRHFNGQHFDSNLLDLLNNMNEFKKKVESLLQAPNFSLLEQAQTVVSTQFSQVAALIDFGEFLNQLVFLIKGILIVFFDQNSIASKIPNIENTLEEMKSLLQKDFSSYSTLLQRFWPSLRNIPKADLKTQLESVLELINKFSSSPSVLEIQDAIKEIRSTAERMNEAMIQYENEMNDSRPSKFLSVNITPFGMNTFVWRPVDRILTMYLKCINKPPFAPNADQLAMHKRIQAHIRTMKSALEDLLNDQFSQFYTFDHVVKIMKYAVELIEIKFYMEEFNECSKIYLLFKLECNLNELVQWSRYTTIPS